MIRRVAVLLAALACAACGPGESGSAPGGVESELAGIESTLDQIEAELAGG